VLKASLENKQTGIVVERLPRKRKALGSVPSSEKKNQKKKKKKKTNKTNNAQNQT